MPQGGPGATKAALLGVVAEGDAAVHAVYRATRKLGEDESTAVEVMSFRIVGTAWKAEMPRTMHVFVATLRAFVAGPIGK